MGVQMTACLIHFRAYESNSDNESLINPTAHEASVNLSDNTLGDVVSSSDPHDPALYMKEQECLRMINCSF